MPKTLLRRDPKFIKKVVAFRAKGKTLGAIAQSLGCSVGVVQCVCADAGMGRDRAVSPGWIAGARQMRAEGFPLREIAAALGCSIGKIYNRVADVVPGRGSGAGAWRWSPEKVERAVHMRNSGMSWGAIARELGEPCSTVRWQVVKREAMGPSQVKFTVPPAAAPRVS